MKVGRAFLQTLGSQAAQSLASIATGVLIARGLGPTGQGAYATFAAGIALGAVIASLGVFHGNVLATASRRTSPRRLLVRAVIQGLLVAGALLGTVPWWGARLGAGIPVAVGFSVVLPLEIIAQGVRGVNLGQHRVTAWNVATLSQRVVYFAGVVALALWLRVRLELVVGCWAIAACASVVVSAVWIWRSSPAEDLGFLSVWRGWSRDVRQGLRAYVVIVLTLLLVRADIWMLHPLLGAAAVGQISVATYLGEWLWYVPSILGNLLFATVAADRSGVSVQQVARGTRAVAGLLLPLMVVLLIGGRTLVGILYGPEYEEAGIAFLMLVPGITALGVHLVIDSYFAGSGFPPITIWAVVLALALKVGLNLALVPSLGIPGAAAATTSVYVVLMTIKVVRFTRQTGLKARAVLLPGRSDLDWMRQRMRSAFGRRPTR